MPEENVAFLGPKGSYTELALTNLVKPQNCTSCSSISEIFDKVVSAEVSAGFVPLENMLQGPITETLDQFYEKRGSVRIENSFTYPISHALGVLPNSSAEKIEIIYSKDIAFRQCSKFLSKNFPDVILSPTSSTGAAAHKIVSEKLSNAAAIAAEETLLALGFQVLNREISDQPGNQTRFALIRKGKFDATHLEKRESSKGLVTSIVVDPGRDRQGLLFEILEVISVRHRCNLNSIHSRPDAKGGFVFHLDLEGGANEKKISNCLADLEKYCSQFTGRTAEIIVFGSHRQTPFTSSKLKSVGIIGGCGVMGSWFADFFHQAGLKVYLSDIVEQKNCIPVEELCKNAEVILISVPMSAMNGVIDSIVPNLRPGHLIVENCSIKAAGLPRLLAESPDGVEVLGVHTMFAADITELRGQNVILTKTEKSKDLSLAFEELIYKHGAITSSVDSKRHDQAAAILQALMQASLVSLGEFLSDNFESVEELETFSTPNSRAVVRTVQRVLKQNKQLLRDLQELNPQSSAARLAFLQTIFKIITALENKEFENFEASAEKARKFFKL